MATAPIMPPTMALAVCIGAAAVLAGTLATVGLAVVAAGVLEAMTTGVDVSSSESSDEDDGINSLEELLPLLESRPRLDALAPLALGRTLPPPVLLARICTCVDVAAQMTWLMVCWDTTLYRAAQYGALAAVHAVR